MQAEARPTQSNTDIFELAAGVLAGDGAALDSGTETKVRGFLDILGYSRAEDVQGQSEDVVCNRVSLLRAAATLGGIFRLHGRSAPGLTFFGAKAVPPMPSNVADLSASLNGAGETPRQAFEACIGEGVEYLSQFRRIDDDLKVGTFEDVTPWKDTWATEPVTDWLDHKTAGKSSAIEWMAAKRLLDNEAGWLPAALVLRDPDRSVHLEQRLALGCGCAAGASWAAAVTSALLEILERDAVALWWRGGGPGKPIALETLANTGASDLIGRIRKDTHDRVTTLIDITSEFEIPCIAAISFNRDCSGFAAGFACRLNAAQACKAAIVEMCQMELGHDVVAAKRSSLGADSLNEADIRQERRGTKLLPSQVHLIDGLIGTASLRHLQTESLSGLLSRLASAGFHAYAADLTRTEFAIPVARVVIPGLQPYPSTFVSPRLAAASSAAHKSPYANGIDLF